jgi:hypothetical protein
MRSEIVLIVAALGLMPIASRAQEQGGAVACPSIQNDQDRLACYDHAMRGTPGAPAAQTPAPRPAPATSPAATPGPAANTAPTASPSATAPPVPSSAGSVTPATAAPATPAVVAAAAAGTAAATHAAETTVAPAATSSSTISTSPHNGRNTTAATPPQPPAPPTFDPNTGIPTGIIPVVVLSALTRPGFGTEFTTDKGGIWIQTETKPLTLPKTPFNAELQPGKFGSTFLVLPDRKLGIRVRQSGK